MLQLVERHLQAAAASMPSDVFDYYASGSGDEVAAQEAEASWRQYRFRPRVLRDVASVDLSVDLLGCRLPTPVGVAPMAFHGLAHPEGELATAAGAGVAGALVVVSTRASRALEDVAAAMTGPWWFQVYVMRDRGLTRALVQRAADAGARALVLTGDTPYVGIKRRVGGVRFAVPEHEFLVNLGRHLGTGVDTASAAAQDPSAGLEVLDELSSSTGLPVLVKGVLRGDDAERCLDAGAAGIVVSNHGGRQLSRAVPSAVALPEVVQAVAGRAPVLVDGGIRCGADVLAALGLGASAVLVGRPVLWALASGGSEAVAGSLRAITDDLAHAVALAGATGPTDLPRGLVVRADGSVP